MSVLLLIAALLTGMVVVFRRKIQNY